MKTKRYGYQDIRDAIELSVKYGVRRAYKHLNDPEPAEEIIERIAEIAADDAMNDLCEMIEFREGKP